MKRISILLAAALTLAACQKNETPSPSNEGATLYATIEDVAATKTYMDANNNIRWSEGDQVVAFMKTSLGLRYEVATSSVGKTSAHFDEVGGNGGGLNAGTEWDHNIVYYPYSESIEAAKSGNNYVLNTVLPSEQNYAAGSFGNGAMAMVAVSENNNITFKNILGGMKLQLKGTQKVASIILRGKNNEKLSGAATVTAYTEATKPAITMASGASPYIVLNCGSGVQLKESTATDFIIALPPVLFSEGFIVTVTDTKSNTYTVGTDNRNEVFRSSLLIMPVVTLEAVQSKPNEGDYIDEYGINHGQGVRIRNSVWAPVNCGYHPTFYPYGKLYQLGRKYGQGGSDDISSPIFALAPASIDEAQSKDYENTFFTDWSDQIVSNLWKSGTEENPVKTIYDPCPDGWRVPTYSELNQLLPDSGFEIDSRLQGLIVVGVGDTQAEIFLPLFMGMRMSSGEIVNSVAYASTSVYNSVFYATSATYHPAEYEWVEDDSGLGHYVLIEEGYYSLEYSSLFSNTLGHGTRLRCVQIAD